MAMIIYGKSIADKTGQGIGEPRLREAFAEASAIRRKLEEAGKRVGCFFIDPLLEYFEAGNRFYFRVLGSRSIRRMNWYRTGAGPVLALTDAKELLDADRCDAVFLFGHDPLLSARNSAGKTAVRAAMDIFSGASLLACYNALAENLCREYRLTPEEFAALADALFANYARTWTADTGRAKIPPRGRFMEDAEAPLFRLTDCANPNLDFAGGVILCNGTTADFLGIPQNRRVHVAAAAYSVVEAEPGDPASITGSRKAPFPHLQGLFSAVESASGLDLPTLLRDGGLILDAYTCYPPIPMGFLLAGGFIGHLRDLPDFLEQYPVTVDGGLNLYGAPWNSPVLGSLAAVWDRLTERGGYGLVHGNGGMGETQGLALLRSSLPGS